MNIIYGIKMNNTLSTECYPFRKKSICDKLYKNSDSNVIDLIKYILCILNKI